MNYALKIPDYYREDKGSKKHALDILNSSPKC